MRRLIGRGLERTAALWPAIERVYGWGHRAAHGLGNEAGETAAAVRRRFDGLVGAMARHRAGAGDLAGAVHHFREVTRSYRPGLFHRYAVPCYAVPCYAVPCYAVPCYAVPCYAVPCYAVPGLPRTDTGLEQLFGSQRYHARRATGRKTASPATVLRGEVRLIAATATRLHPPAARDLGRISRERWSDLRQRLDQRRQARTLRTRFRRDPEAYLAALEWQACQPALPP